MTTGKDPNFLNCPIGEDHKEQIREIRSDVEVLKIDSAANTAKILERIESMNSSILLYGNKIEKLDGSMQDIKLSDSKREFKYWYLIVLLVSVIIFCTNHIFPALMTPIIIKVFEYLIKVFKG
jgi:hypothetical protein